jgi:hypothetical protein
LQSVTIQRRWVKLPDVAMVICKWCQQELSTGVSCTVTQFDDMPGGPTGRIPYGAESEDWGAAKRPQLP